MWMSRCLIFRCGIMRFQETSKHVLENFFYNSVSFFICSNKCKGESLHIGDIFGDNKTWLASVGPQVSISVVH